MNSEQINRSIGKALWQARESRGLTRMDIWHRTKSRTIPSHNGVTPAELARFELGEVRPDSDTIKRLLDAMAGTVSEIEARIRDNNAQAAQAQLKEISNPDRGIGDLLRLLRSPDEGGRGQSA